MSYQPSDPVPPQSPTPPPKKPRGALFWAWILVSILLVFIVGGAVLTTSLQSAPATTDGAPVTPTDVPTDTPVPTATLDTSIATDTPVPTQAAPPPATWKTIQSFRGNGIKKTAIFTVPDDWRISWSCTGFTSVNGAIGVIVYGSDNSTRDVAVNATCKAGSQPTKDSTEEHQGGDIYLSIDATGDWTVEVQQFE